MNDIMKLNCRKLSGGTFDIEAEETDSIYNVKQKISNEITANIKQLQLLYLGWKLDNNLTLNHYGITKDSTLFIIVLHTSNYPLYSTIV